MAEPLNQLWYGDNLQVLKEQIPNESVDLVYLDPPFNSNRSYNVLFKNKTGEDAMAQIEAFDDTWTWSHESEEQYRELVGGSAPIQVADSVEGLRKLLGENDMLAYLVMMASRLVELHRVMKPTATLYLHCDPTASHYLKVLLDSIFGTASYLNEVTWKRSTSHGNVSRNYGSLVDILLVYVKSKDYTWNQQHTPYTDEYVKKRFRYSDPDGRRWRSVTLRNPSVRPNLQYDFVAEDGTVYKPHPNGWAVELKKLQRYEQEDRLHFPAKPGGRLNQKQYLDEMKGIKLQNLWDDIPPVNPQARERLGYPTQKPVALLERIVANSSSEGDVVLDPFCGCGTTIDAAQRLNRRWVGIDVTYLSVDLIRKRLRNTFGDKVSSSYEVFGIPQDLSGAQAMFEKNPFEFERWVVSLIDGQPNEKQVGDKGVDGIVRFPISREMDVGRVVVSVKGGKQLNPAMVRDLVGTVQSQRAEMGVLVTMQKPTKGMKDAARKAGIYEWPISGQTYPKVQIVTVPDLFAGKSVNMPTPLLPYVKAPGFAGYQGRLFDPVVS